MKGYFVKKNTEPKKILKEYRVDKPEDFKLGSEIGLELFKDVKELDCAIMLGDLRFRANFYQTMNGTGAVLRRVETKAPSMEDLNLMLPVTTFELEHD